MHDKNLEQQASEFRRWANWKEAQECYEQMLTDPSLGPLDRAKTLANRLQMQVKRGDRSGAIASGREALDLVATHQLYETKDGILVRGFVEGQLARLTGDARFAAGAPLSCIVFCLSIAFVVWVFTRYSDWSYRAAAVIWLIALTGFLKQRLYPT